MDAQRQGDIVALPAGTAVADAPRVVLFDFDGVVIHGDAFYLFMRARYERSLPRKLLALLSLPVLILAWPFSRKWPMRMLIRIALLGVGAKRYPALARSFAAELTRRPRQFCRDALRALRQHQAAGDRVIVVTGCEEQLVQGIFGELGLDGLEVLASQLAFGWLGVQIVSHNIGQRKLQRLAAHGVASWAVAYSDSAHDLPMLKRADQAVLVNGTPRLCKKVEKGLGRSVTRVAWQ